jgi:DNA-binding response OmpR family regulator
MSSGMDLKDECLDAGANDFILKPYMPDELVYKITNLLKE